MSNLVVAACWCISLVRTFYLKLNIIFLLHVFAELQEFVPLTSPAPTENHRNLLANCDCENIFLDKNIYFIEMITARVRPCYGLITTQGCNEDFNSFDSFFETEETVMI